MVKIFLINIELTFKGTRSGERSAVKACHMAVCRPVAFASLGTSSPTKATGANGVEVNESGREDSIVISVLPKELVISFYVMIFIDIFSLFSTADQNT